MKRGPRPAPNEIKKAKGVMPCRVNSSAPDFVPDLNPMPPDHLDVYGREEWDRIYPEVTGKGVLKIVDRMVLVGYCEAYSEYRKASVELAKCKKQVCTTPNGAIQAVPYVSMKRNWLLVMLRYANDLGITPSSRGRISGDNGKKSSGIREFMQKAFNK